MKDRMQIRFLTKIATGTFLMATIAATSGCTTTNAQDNAAMTPHEARDTVLNFVVDTSEHVDAENWSAETGAAVPQNCTLDNGEEGAAYQFRLWSADRSSDSMLEADRIVEYWDSLGMDTRVADHGGHPVVYGTGGPVVRASFDTDAAGESYSIGAVAPCTPGNAADLKREANTQREDGERVPGDEYVPEEKFNDSSAT